MIAAIWRAGESDASSIEALLRGSFAEYESLYTPAAYAATTPAAETLRARLAEGPTWVAVGGDRIVGTVSAVERVDGVYVRSMAVAPECRGRGIARSLLQKTEAFAKDRGARRLYLSTTPFLFDAILFYARAGFVRTEDPPHELHGTPLFTMVLTLR